jgi:hypothetical protein
MIATVMTETMTETTTVTSSIEEIGRNEIYIQAFS